MKLYFAYGQAWELSLEEEKFFLQFLSLKDLTEDLDLDFILIDSQFEVQIIFRLLILHQINRDILTFDLLNEKEYFHLYLKFCLFYEGKEVLEWLLKILIFHMSCQEFSDYIKGLNIDSYHLYFLYSHIEDIRYIPVNFLLDTYFQNLWLQNHQAETLEWIKKDYQMIPFFIRRDQNFRTTWLKFRSENLKERERTNFQGNIRDMKMALDFFYTSDYKKILKFLDRLVEEETLEFADVQLEVIHNQKICFFETKLNFEDVCSFSVLSLPDELHPNPEKRDLDLDFLLEVQCQGKHFRHIIVGHDEVKCFLGDQILTEKKNGVLFDYEKQKCYYGPFFRSLPDPLICSSYEEKKRHPSRPFDLIEYVNRGRKGIKRKIEMPGLEVTFHRIYNRIQFSFTEKEKEVVFRSTDLFASTGTPDGFNYGIEGSRLIYIDYAGYFLQFGPRYEIEVLEARDRISHFQDGIETYREQNLHGHRLKVERKKGKQPLIFLDNQLIKGKLTKDRWDYEIETEEVKLSLTYDQEGYRIFEEFFIKKQNLHQSFIWLPPSSNQKTTSPSPEKLISLEIWNGPESVKMCLYKEKYDPETGLPLHYYRKHNKIVNEKGIIKDNEPWFITPPGWSLHPDRP